MYKQINTQAGNNISDSQPIKTYSKMFQSLKPLLEFHTFVLIFFTGFGVSIIILGFLFDIVKNRKVWNCLKRSDLWCGCFHCEFFFGLSLNAQCFLIFLWILMQIRNVNFFSVHLLFMVAGWKNVKSVLKMCETHFQNIIITYFEQVFLSWIRSLKIDWNSANITWLNT